jgi:hypothetical membrane protein
MLLFAGVLSSVVYISSDVLCGLRYPGYSFTNQVISELSAIGAPTTALWATLLRGYAILFVAFTLGVFRASVGNRQLRRVAWLLVVFVLTAPVWSFFPMHQRGEPFTWTDAGHIAMGGVSVVLLTAVIAVGAGALGHRFRLFSRVAAAVVLSTGAATFLYAPRMIDQLPTPGVGIIERFALYGFLIWSAVLAVALIRDSRKYPQP